MGGDRIHSAHTFVLGISASRFVRVYKFGKQKGEVGTRRHKFFRVFLLVRARMYRCSELSEGRRVVVHFLFRLGFILRRRSNQG